MSRARFLAASILPAILLLPGSTVAAEGFLLLPLASVDVASTTAEAVRVFLAGELEVRNLKVVRPADAPRCEDLECARQACISAGAEKVVYGNLIRLGPKIAVRLEALRVGEEKPFFREQLTVSDEGSLDEALRAIAAGIARESPRADRSLFNMSRSQLGVIPAGGAPPPRIAFQAGLLFPTGDSYGGAERLVSLRLSLQNELPGLHLEATLPMAGLAWSGHLGESWDEDGALDWTLFDLFAAHRVDQGRRSFHLGAGLGLHHIRIESGGKRITPPAKTVAVRGGSAETTALTGDFGGGVRLAGDGTSELSFLLRYHHVFADVGGDGDEGARGVYFGFGAVL